MSSAAERWPPVAPVFFVSYARMRSIGLTPTAGPDELVMRFFTDLSVNVNELISLDIGEDPGFIDRAIRGGEQWEPELLEAAGRCQVLVPLVSPAYLRSRWCMRELELFSGRPVINRESGRPDHVSAIVPVLWVPTERSAMPPKIRAVQQFTPLGVDQPRIATQYEENGIYGLLRTKQEEAYQTVVWKLSMRIREICLKYYVVAATNGREEAS
ncbi:MAG: TIR-like protein FxsC [Actinoplanes sp.]